MTITEIFEQFRRLPAEGVDFAPYEKALLAASEQQEAITPELIALIESAADNPELHLNDFADARLPMAIYLLAQFKEPHGLAPFLRFLALPNEQALDLTGDMLTEDGGAILASVCNGDPAPILRVILEESFNEYIRTAAIEALLIQHAWGERPREALVEDLRRLFQTMSKPGHAYVWAGLIGAVGDLHLPELASEARQAFAEGLVDEDSCDEEWMDECLKEPAEKAFQGFSERHGPINAIHGIGSWCCFKDNQGWIWDKDEEDLNFDREPVSAPQYTPYIPPPPQKPYIAPPKPGRNEPCLCGSGKKYKKCCGKG